MKMINAAIKKSKEIKNKTKDENLKKKIQQNIIDLTFLLNFNKF